VPKITDQLISIEIQGSSLEDNQNFKNDMAETNEQLTPKIGMTHLICSLAGGLVKNLEQCRAYILQHDLGQEVDTIIRELSKIREIPLPDAKSRKRKTTADGKHDTVEEPETKKAATNNDVIDLTLDPKRFPKKPRCLEDFKLSRFHKFLLLRSQIDIMFERRNEIFEFQKDGSIAFKISEDKRELKYFENAHAVAYFYYMMKECDIWSNFTQKAHRMSNIHRKYILDIIAPNFGDSDIARQQLHGWGSVLTHSSSMQWIGGTSDSKLSYSTVIEWKKKLLKYEKEVEIRYEQHIIHGKVYLTPPEMDKEF
jgi:hypothetical protein